MKVISKISVSGEIVILLKNSNAVQSKKDQKGLKVHKE